MRKICCVCLAFFLCLMVCGCQNDSSKNTPTPTLRTPSDGYELVIPGEFDDYVYGEIIEKILPDTLVLKTQTPRMIKAWGETVCIITDDADEWCVGDEIDVVFSVAERPREEGTDKYVRIFADNVTPLALTAKPIIYLYPETPTVCSVKVDLKGEFTCTYPVYGDDGWQNFTAYPDGTLVFPDGKEYYALYWEAIQGACWDFFQGYCVRGEDTAAFLEWALAEQGLTKREANEFIIYWLPLMQENPYNVITFQTTDYVDSAPLEITPYPDSVLRVFMTYYPSDTEVDLAPQTFEGFERKGFTVVEWGGSEVKKP